MKFETIREKGVTHLTYLTRNHKSPPVTLPRLPWEEGGKAKVQPLVERPYGRPPVVLPFARTALVRAEVLDSFEVHAGAVRPRTVPVWRRAPSRAVQKLGARGATVIQGLEADVAALGASAGSLSALTGGGGGCAGSKLPNAASIEALERLRAAHSTVTGDVIEIRPTRQDRVPVLRLSLWEALLALAVEGRSRREILADAGLAVRSHRVEGIFDAAVADAVDRLAWIYCAI